MVKKPEVAANFQYCCKKLTRAINDGKIRFDGKQWHTVSSSVYMLVELKRCMWCGTKLPDRPKY
jgi:hypothetical protein